MTKRSTTQVPSSTGKAGPREGGVLHDPRTALGRHLREILERIVASGNPLLSWEEIEREVKVRRGERQAE